MEQTGRGGGRQAVVAALTAALVAALVVAWGRYENADRAGKPVAVSSPARARAEAPPERAVLDEVARRHARPADSAKRSGANRAAQPRAPAAQEPVLHGTGEFVVATGSSDVAGDGPVQRFLVEVEKGTRVDPEAVAGEVEAILFDERGWTADPSHALQRVDEGAVDFRVTLASPDTVDRECLPLRTNGRFSCWNGERAMLNLWRWLEGADTYGDDLEGYRRYLVNHEVGHALGYGHARCPSGGAPAPAMMQQSIDVGACEPNPWPHPTR